MLVNIALRYLRGRFFGWLDGYIVSILWHMSIQWSDIT